MIGHVIQQLQPINTVANLKPDHMCSKPCSKHITMSDTETSELEIGDFDPETYQHVLPEGAHDYDDYDSNYEKENPELGFTDEQVEAEVKKLGPEDRKLYEDYKEFLDSYYQQHGRIIELPDLIKIIMTRRFPEIPSTTQKEQDELRRSS